MHKIPLASHTVLSIAANVGDTVKLCTCQGVLTQKERACRTIKLEACSLVQTKHAAQDSS